MTTEENKICTCGHKKKQHSVINGECYVVKHLEGCHYQCICQGFQEKGEK